MHAGHAQRTATGIADRQGAVRTAPGAHPAKRRRPSDCQLAGRCLAGDVDAVRARRIIARHSDRRRLSAKAERLEPDWYRQRVARTDRDRIGQHLRHQELAGRGRNTGHGQRTLATVGDNQWLVGKRADADIAKASCVGDHQVCFRCRHEP